MKKLFGLLVAGLVLAACNVLPAEAQNTRVFTACGSAAWSNLDLGRQLQLQPDGTLCVTTFPGGVTYETVAASQTAQVLGTTGAIGDYLSHCVIYPVTTAAGAVTVFDNANAAATNVITFTAGTLSDLAPIPVPVGAKSTAGGWKVTTSTNVTVTCYGKFT